MSKLFDIMYSGKGEIADLFRPLVGAETSPPQPAAARTNGDKPVPTPAADQPRAEAPGRSSLAGKVRTLSLRIPAPSPLLPFEQGQWRPSEQYRILRTKIVQHAAQPRMIVISSPASGDGKSVSAINTAAALSLKVEARVLLVDADFRKSSVHAVLGLPFVDHAFFNQRRRGASLHAGAAGNALRIHEGFVARGNHGSKAAPVNG